MLFLLPWWSARKVSGKASVTNTEGKYLPWPTLFFFFIQERIVQCCSLSKNWPGYLARKSKKRYSLLGQHISQTRLFLSSVKMVKVQALVNRQPVRWIEIPFTVPRPGLYSRIQTLRYSRGHCSVQSGSVLTLGCHKMKPTWYFALPLPVWFREVRWTLFQPCSWVLSGRFI